METRILIFIDWFLPGYKAGGPVTSVSNMINKLQDGYEFYVLTRNTDYGCSEAYPGLEADTWIRKAKNLHVCYCSKDSLSKKKLKRQIQEANCPIWYITGIYSYYFSILPVLLSRKYKARKLVLVPRGMLSKQALGVKGLKKRIFLKIARILRIYENVIFQATNAMEAKDIKIIFPKNEVIVAANLPRSLNADSMQIRNKKEGNLDLIYAARISPEKNTLGALQTLLDWSESAYFNADYSINFHLMGQVYDPAYWSRCQLLIDRMPMNILVELKETMPHEDVLKEIQKYHFLFLPTNGENYGHSIVETFSAARPVIISDRTPWRNLSSMNVGWDLSLDEPQKFVSVLDQCLKMSNPEFSKMCSDSLGYAKNIIFDKEALDAHKRIFTL